MTQKHLSSRQGGPLTVSPSLAAAAALDVQRQLATPATSLEPSHALSAPPEQHDPDPEPTPEDQPYNPVAPVEPDAEQKAEGDEIADAELVLDEPEPPATTLVRAWPGEIGREIPRFGIPTTRTPAPRPQFPASRNALP